MFMPALSCDQAAAHELAAKDFDGAYFGSTLGATALR